MDWANNDVIAIVLNPSHIRVIEAPVMTPSRAKGHSDACM